MDEFFALSVFGGPVIGDQYDLRNMDHGAKRTEQGRASKAQGGASEVSGDSPPDKGRDSVCEADCDCESAWSVESLPSVAP